MNRLEPRKRCFHTLNPAMLFKEGRPWLVYGTLKTADAASSVPAPLIGISLGLYLTRAVMTQLGGALELSSRTGEGTVAALVLPPSAVRGD